jgi:hypothetical protein
VVTEPVQLVPLQGTLNYLEIVKLQKRQHYYKNREAYQLKQRQYYHSHKDAIRELRKTQRQDKGDFLRADERSYYQRNRERIRETWDRHWKRNGEILKDRRRHYLARKRLENPRKTYVSSLLTALPLPTTPPVLPSPFKWPALRSLFPFILLSFLSLLLMPFPLRKSLPSPYHGP